MYILWSRGSTDLNFPLEIPSNGSQRRAKREASTHTHGGDSDINDGMVMAQLLRADKLEIPEKLNKSKVQTM